MCCALSILLSSYLILTDTLTQQTLTTSLKAKCIYLPATLQDSCRAISNSNQLVPALGILQSCNAIGVLTKHTFLQASMFVGVLAMSLLMGNWQSQRGVGLEIVTVMAAGMMAF